MCGAVGQSALMATRTLYAKTNTQAQTAKIPNTKHQITNKSQTSISNDQNR
jgi:hypothetical protein